MKLNLKKTWDMVVKGRTSQVPPKPISGIERKPQLKLLGVTFSTDPCNWNAHFDSTLKKPSSRLYVLRICKHYEYSFAELTALFESLIMCISPYGIEVWGCAFESTYISHIDKFGKSAFKSGYTADYTPFTYVIRKRDMKLWNQITVDSDHCLHDLLPMQKNRKLRNRGHNYILPRIRAER